MNRKRDIKGTTRVNVNRGQAGLFAGQQDGNGVIPPCHQAESKRNIITGKALSWLNQREFQAGQISMGLMHRANKDRPKQKGTQINQAVLIIDAGEKHDDEQQPEHESRTSRQDEYVLLTEALDIGPRNPSVNPATKAISERIFHSRTEALRCPKSSWYSTTILR